MRPLTSTPRNSVPAPRVASSSGMNALIQPVLMSPIRMPRSHPGFQSVVRHAVGHVDVPLRVDRDRARLAELRPARDEVALLVEHLDALVAAIGDVEPALGVDLDAVRIVELERQAAFGADAAAPRLDELAVLREAHQPVVAAARPVHVVLVRSDVRAAVAVGDPDVAVLARRRRRSDR